MKGHPEIEIERRWGNGERCREGEKKKREKSLWCGDEKETEIVSVWIVLANQWAWLLLSWLVLHVRPSGVLKTDKDVQRSK